MLAAAAKFLFWHEVRILYLRSSHAQGVLLTMRVSKIWLDKQRAPIHAQKKKKQRAPITRKRKIKTTYSYKTKAKKI